MSTTNTQHTPGPWLLMPGNLSVSGNDPEGTRYQEIARMINGNTTCTHLQVTADEMKANATLIAAAPELLEACKLALSAFEQNHAIDWSILTQAINKAEGR